MIKRFAAELKLVVTFFYCTAVWVPGIHNSVTTKSDSFSIVALLSLSVLPAILIGWDSRRISPAGVGYVICMVCASILFSMPFGFFGWGMYAATLSNPGVDIGNVIGFGIVSAIIVGCLGVVPFALGVSLDQVRPQVPSEGSAESQSQLAFSLLTCFLSLLVGVALTYWATFSDGSAGPLGGFGPIVGGAAAGTAIGLAGSYLTSMRKVEN